MTTDNTDLNKGKQRGREASELSGLVGRRRRKKWLRPLTTLPIYEAYDRLMGLNKRQLRLTIEAMESCTTTNCWWGDYRTARILLPIAKNRLRPTVGGKPTSGATRNEVGLTALVSHNNVNGDDNAAV